MNLQKLSFSNVIRLMNFYPPYLGAGVRVKVLDKDELIVRVDMNLNIFNKNYVGTHFGGSLYSMVDPFYMLILMRKLGRDFIVWDKKADISFKRPGRENVYAIFEIKREKVVQIREEVGKLGKCEPVFEVSIKNQKGDVIATVLKTLWVKKK